MTPESHPETVNLADLLERARERLRRNHRVRSGTSVALNYSQEIDRLLQAHARVVAASNPRFAGVEQRLALVAVGGYGRRELNLHSDIDLLFVLPGEPHPEDEEFIKLFLYPLWSLRIDLGYSVKPLELVLKEIGEDLDLTTSLFTMHRIWGDEKLFVRLRENLRLQVTLHYEASLSAAIIERLRSRHQRFSDTCQLLEPHLKDSPGGLRDIHVLQWLGFVNFGGEGLHALTAHGLLSPGDERELRQALAFLMELRNGLHIMEGRKTDHLNIERQIRIAPLIGIEARENALPEEQLMRAYYQRVTQVDRIVRRVVRLFENRRMTLKVTGKSRLRARRMEGLFRLRDNQLGIDPKEAAAASADSHWMMHLFSVAALYDYAIDDFTLDLIAGKLTDVDEGFRRSAANRDRFLGILGNRRSAARTLRLMHACGFLDAYLPEFAPVRNLPRIDHYHQFTVDEHLLRAAEAACDLFREGGPLERSHAAAVARELLRWDLLVFAVLLHDIGKGEGRGHVIRGAHIVQRISERMGLTRKEARILHDLVLNHQRLSHLALKRNPEDPQVPRDLARDIGDAELLRMLYVLTCCDLRAVSNESWNDWRATLLASLYERSMDILLGRKDGPHAHVPSHDALAKLVLESSGEVDASWRDYVDRLLADLPERYRQATPPPVVARHMKLARQLDDKCLVAWDLETLEGANYAFLHCVARDSPGLFANLCGALASRRFNILSAQIFTARNGVCIDVFQIQDIDNQQPRDPEPLDRVFQKLNESLARGARIDWTRQMPRGGPALSPARLEFRPPTVNISSDASGDGYTLIEVRAHDRPGLLYSITSVLEQFRLNIHVALVATESYQVVDVFYVTDLENNRLEPGPSTEKLRKALLAAVSPEPQQVATP